MMILDQLSVTVGALAWFAVALAALVAVLHPSVQDTLSERIALAGVSLTAAGAAYTGPCSEWLAYSLALYVGSISWKKINHIHRQPQTKRGAIMELAEVHRTAVTPALKLLGMPEEPRALVMMFATGLQESRFTARRQHGNGPARGFWQFERMGGVNGVLKHPASKALAAHLCLSQGVAPQPLDTWASLENNDVLAAGFARLLLYTDPRPLPALGNEAAAWDYYLNNWRPGQPHPQTWPRLYAQALAYVQGLEG